MPSTRSKSLNDLLVRLQSAADAEAAQQIEHSIWEIWCQFDDGNEHINHLMERAALMVRQQRLEHALVLCNTVIELAPEFAEGWNRRATLHYLRGDYASSARDIKQTLLLEPRHFGALSGLGLIMIRLRAPDAAIVAFEKALAVNPHAANVRYHLKRLRNLVQ